MGILYLKYQQMVVRKPIKHHFGVLFVDAVPTRTKLKVWGSFLKTNLEMGRTNLSFKAQIETNNF